MNAYTVAMPWYERADFDQLLALAEDRIEMAPNYDLWRAQALAVAEQYIATGKALQLVTIRPGEYLAWMRERHLPNTAATRLRYVELMALAQSGPAAHPSLKEVDYAQHEPNESRENRA